MRKVALGEKVEYRKWKIVLRKIKTVFAIHELNFRLTNCLAVEQFIYAGS